ncbi:hypothetical protein [uncultured Desulfuromusa sp.]|uniref:hypothetical protein n=1 Tax=uncultured Desulfuromusa sp. TaxID=219183 RepID=UPI002AA7C567|nr:hypothetical protein [uncultured Desulfuromusa sp.]
MKNRNYKPLLSVILIFGFTFNLIGYALALEYRGSGEIQYSWMLDSKERVIATDAALQSVIESWIAQERASLSRSYYKVKEQIDADVRNYILSYQTIDEIVDKGKKTYKIILRAAINEPLLMRKINESSIDSDGIDPDSYIAFIFVARQQTGKESHSEKSATSGKSVEKRISKNQEENTASIEKSKSNTIAVKKTERTYKDKILWDVATANEIDVAMGDVFTDARYYVVDAAFLMDESNGLFDPDKFIDDYRYGHDISSKTKRDAIVGLQSLADPVQFFAIGTMDVNGVLTDKLTGKVKVSVSVTGQVLSVEKRGAAVAKVGPVQFSGLGDTITMAKNNALKLASHEAAKVLVDKLSAR